MKGDTGERWRELCAKAAEEQDPDKLMELVAEISRMLEDKERWLKSKAEAASESK
jgi:hypothetical protein